jgi:predicted acylesterase/phospholipase RssA
MDRKLSEKTEVERLIRLSENARSCLESEAGRIRRRLDVPARIRDSLSAHPTSWLFGSLASGLVASMLFSRRSQPAVKTKSRGIPGMLLGLTLTAVRPLAKVWLSNQASRWMCQSASYPPVARPLPKTRFP